MDVHYVLFSMMYFGQVKCLLIKSVCVCVCVGYLVTSWELLVLAASRRASPFIAKTENNTENITYCKTNTVNLNAQMCKY